MSIHSFLRSTITTRGQVDVEAANTIGRVVCKNESFMIARFGSNEIKAVLYPMLPRIIQVQVESKLMERMRMAAGFFPSTKLALHKFSKLMLDDMRQLDILGTWRIEESLLQRRFSSARRVELRELEPYLSSQPWTQYLKGKRILVIHPFARLIEQQYITRRKLLFADSRVLPDFCTFETFKAVQSIAGNASEFSDWFVALDWMKSEIDKKVFDVALVGCGAYGFPLAAHIKRSGRSAVHLGGATQILFGIKGKRWDDDPNISKFYNSNWVRPESIDIPDNFKKVEDGCYW